MTDTRPETIDDLPTYRREPELLATIKLDAGGFAVGLGAAVDQIVTAFGEVYADAMTVHRDHGSLEIHRDRTHEELVEALYDLQRMWDRRHAGATTDG